MATYNKGILGAFSGKVGPVVGSSWRGMDVLRSLPRKRKHTPSEKQLQQQLKFTTVLNFLLPFKPVTSLYFGTPSAEKSRVNLAMSYHLTEAIDFNGTTFDILYNKVQLTKGDLLNVQDLEVLTQAGSILKFNWTDNSGQSAAKATDKMVVVVYEPIGGLSEMFLEAGLRGDGTSQITLQPYFAGMQVECWVGFVAEDGKKQSTSVYMGTLNVL